MPLNGVRMRVVERAFKSLDRSGDGVISKDEMEVFYDTARHPAVLRKDITPQAALDSMMHAFDTSGDGFVQWNEWIAYYEAVSRDIEDDGDFHMIVTRTWQLDQPNRVNRQQLASTVRDGFKSSAYRSQAGRSSEEEAHARAGAGCSVVLANANLGLDPMPMPKAGVAPKNVISYHDSNAGKQTMHRVSTRGATQLTIPPPDSHCTLGSTGLPGSKGFLNATSSTQRGVGTGEFDPEVIEAFQRGKKAEQDAARKRAELQNAPFQSAAPAAFARSSQVHAPLASAVNRDRPAHPKTQRNAAPATDAELKAVLDQQREDYRKTLTIGRAKTSGLKTTAQDHFAALDTTAAMAATDRFNAKPYSNRGDADVPEPRGANGWETEYSSHMQDRHKECERDVKYDCKGTFKLIHGVPQMHPASHKPRDVTGTGARASDVVPDHFQTTNKVNFV